MKYIKIFLLSVLLIAGGILTPLIYAQDTGDSDDDVEIWSKTDNDAKREQLKDLLRDFRDRAAVGDDEIGLKVRKAQGVVNRPKGFKRFGLIPKLGFNLSSVDYGGQLEDDRDGVNVMHVGPVLGLGLDIDCQSISIEIGVMYGERGIEIDAKDGGSDIISDDLMIPILLKWNFVNSKGFILSIGSGIEPYMNANGKIEIEDGPNKAVYEDHDAFESGGVCLPIVLTMNIHNIILEGKLTMGFTQVWNSSLETEDAAFKANNAHRVISIQAGYRISLF